ncbi:TPA: hypothetical protein ACQNX3_000928 [Streptococcus pyogenes]|uniref:hypothetical protein n=1 Tax=Streptococcus pyogenes TaxID=1314 RepID=UPI0010D915E7|nr:hypothetical protein [Streptococcus pyogenes]QQA65114.1 hypothetical protein JAN99_03380 [Streptococcus pyogenes]VHE85310.1 phage membrane protein [Streptococcus pyogenes]VHF13177.1 phage membrane protein [Streptococcus pyogenes]VHM44321.1 phage membrane protein [Streptococcus pyogenes]HEQ4680494.1 hypothetical protein [Streptococcus pyogenes]
MTEEQMIACLFYELVKKDKAIKKKNIIITALTVMLIVVSGFFSTKQKDVHTERPLG